MTPDILARAAELRALRLPAVMVTLVETRGSTPRKPGARMLVHPDGSTEGTIGGGSVERAVTDDALRALSREEPLVIEYKLTHELAMCCGGQMRFFVEPLMHSPALIVFGCGHIGSAVVDFASRLGFDVVAIDELEENANTGRFPYAHGIVNSYTPADLGDLPFGDDAYVVIVTREHSIDQRLLELCADKPWAYLGVIGSQRKAHLQRQRLAAKGVSDETIGRMRCPVGIDIGAQTPEEIAISVCAELIAERHQKSASR